MVDPDEIEVLETNLSNVINIKNVPEFDIEVYNLEDEKDFKKYVLDIERSVRRSFEYRQFIRYIRDNMNMSRCSFLKDITNEETFNIKIEIHHYPFSLADIVQIVIRKRQYYNESLEVQMVSKEVMELHYKMVVGLIPLSETVHQLFHSGKLFIPSDVVMGRYNLFVDYYEPFIEENQIETLRRIEKYTLEKRSELLNTTIIDQNRVNYNIEANNYTLPDFTVVNDTMIKQLETIKANNYLLPTAKEIENPIVNNKVAKPVISFDMGLRDYNKYPKRKDEKYFPN